VSFGSHNSEESLLSVLGKTITPVFSPMGITRDNWPATVGLFTGLLAKESVVGTLNSLYGQKEALAEMQKGLKENDGFNFWGGIAEAFLSVPRNFADLGRRFLGFVGGGGRDSGCEDEGIDSGVFERLRSSFTPAAAYAYLVFILLYFPCVAAQGAALRELGRRLGWLLPAYLTGIAWVAAVFVFQIGEGGSVLWIGISLLAAASIAAFFVFFGKKVFGVE